MFSGGVLCAPHLGILAQAEGRSRYLLILPAQQDLTMSDDKAYEGPLEYAIREYRRLFEEARTGQRPWDEEATLRAIAAKTHVTVEELRAAISPSSHS